MSALDECRKYNEHLAAHPTAELEARRYIDLADAALAEETARADRAEALLRYVLMQDMEHGDRGREPLDGLIERLGAFMDAEVQP